MKIGYDMIARREVPIKVVLQGEVAYGYKLTSVGVTPKSLLVEGPQRLVNALQMVNTDPVNVSGSNENTRFSVSISSDLPAIRLIETNSVAVDVGIEEIYMEKIIEKIPVAVNNKSKVKSYSPLSVNVVIKVSLRAKQEFSSNSIRAELDVQNLSKGKHIIPVTIILSPEVKAYVKVIKLEPSFIAVNIKE